MDKNETISGEMKSGDVAIETITQMEEIEAQMDKELAEETADGATVEVAE